MTGEHKKYSNKQQQQQQQQQLTPWIRVRLEKLVKKFPAFYGTTMFIAVFTRARQQSATQTV
jgi:hypothetical protein